MHRTPVTSTCLNSVGYDPKSRTLELEFHKGGIYQYFDVPARIHDQLMSASSKGRFFISAIRDEYHDERVG